MSTLNWVLAGVAFVLWVGTAIWFFRDMVRQAWIERHDKWFRD